MVTGSTCPACRVDIGFASVLFAPSAQSVVCPNCSTRLCYPSARPAVVAAHVGLLLILLVGVVLVPRVADAFQLIREIAVGTVVLVVALECSVSRYVYKTQNVQLAGERSDRQNLVWSALAGICIVLVVVLMAYLFPA